MAIEVRKKIDESVESMLRRFSKRVQQSGIIWRVKKGRFYLPQKSKTQKRKDALHRLAFAARQEYLRKIGKLDETEDWRKKKRKW